jgi:hypothetical protein
MAGEELENGQEGGEQQTNPEVEAEAKLFGWVPREEFRGDEAQWVDAETFVRRGKEINPILKKNNERLMGELRQRDAQISEMQLTLKEFGEMYKKMSETAYTRALAEVKAQIKAARREGDDDLVEQLEEQRDSLVAESKEVKIPGLDKPPTAQPSKEQAQALLQSWVEANPWYNHEKNPDLVYLADGYAMRLAKTKPHLVGTQGFLDEVSAEMRRIAPDKFKNPRREAGSPVSGGSESRAGSRPGGKKTYADLPPEAKAACDRFVKQIPGYKRETYVDSYFEGE